MLPQCQQLLNSWCDRNCPHSASAGALTALQGASANGPQLAWRCYASSTLDAQRRQYTTGSTYCTRDAPLRRLLEQCAGRAGEAATQTYSVDPTGAMRRQPQQDATAQVRRLQEEQQRQQRQQGTFDAAAKARVQGQQAREGQRRWEEPVGIWMPVRPPHKPLDMSPPPTYVHDERFLKLPASLVLPRFDECDAAIAASAQFWGISLYSAAYSEKARRRLDTNARRPFTFCRFRNRAARVCNCTGASAMHAGEATRNFLRPRRRLLSADVRSRRRVQRPHHRQNVGRGQQPVAPPPDRHEAALHARVAALV